MPVGTDRTEKQLLAGMFLLGCAAASVIVPLRAPAIRAGTNPQKWEQMCVPKNGAVTGMKIKDCSAAEVNKPTGWNKVLAEHGAQGWEFVSVLNIHDHIFAACFKQLL